MENYMGSPINSSMDHANRIERMYPDLYTRVYPHVQYIVNSIDEESMYNLTNDDIDRFTEEAIRTSNALNDPPMGHNRDTIGDMTRALVVRDFHDRFRRHRFIPFFSPFFFFPFDDRDRDRFRDFDRDRDRDRDHDRDHDRDRDRDRGWY